MKIATETTRAPQERREPRRAGDNRERTTEPGSNPLDNLIGMAMAMTGGLEDGGIAPGAELDGHARIMELQDFLETFSSNPNAGDPTSSSEGGDGLTLLDATASITREPESDAWGLHKDLAQPGGARAKISSELHGSTLGSRVIPPGGGDDGGISGGEVPPSDASLPAQMRFEAAEAKAEARDAARADDALPVQDAEVASAPERPRSEAPSNRGLAATSPNAETVTETTVESKAAEALMMDEAPELPPELVPKPTGDGPVRVRIDDDLAVEVDATGGVVDVTLEGAVKAVERLQDLGPELERQLANSGWDLGTFQSRQDGQRGPTQHHRGNPVHNVESSGTVESPTRVRRGNLIDIIA
jgi:hypothetical protein